MVVVGTDVHNCAHAFVAVDEAGRKLGESSARPTRASDGPGARLALPRFDELATAKFVGETAWATRFKRETILARRTGVTPVPAWSGNTRG